MDLRFGHWPSDCAVTIAEEHFILKIFMVLKNVCSVAKNRALSLTSSIVLKTILFFINTLKK